MKERYIRKEIAFGEETPTRCVEKCSRNKGYYVGSTNCQTSCPYFIEKRDRFTIVCEG